MMYPKRLSIIVFVLVALSWFSSVVFSISSTTCEDIHTPAIHQWTNQTIYLTYQNLTSSPRYAASQVSLTQQGAQISCSYNATGNAMTCGWLSAYYKNAGPFFVLTTQIEWPSVTAPEELPNLVLQKKRSDNYLNDTVSLKLIPLSSNRFDIISSYAGAPLASSGVSSDTQTIDTTPGLHNLTLFWDNHTIIFHLDDFEISRLDRSASSVYWPTYGGYLQTYLNYKNWTTATAGNNSYFIFHDLNVQCIHPDASNCFTMTNPLPGIATCDLQTITWTTPSGQPVNLNVSTTGNSSLNVSGISLNIDGPTMILGGGGLLADPLSSVNVSGDVVVQGPLVLNISSIVSEINSNISITIINFAGNFSGNFSSVQLVGDRNANSSCTRYFATAVLGKRSLSVLISADTSECDSRKANSKLHAIIMAIAVGVILLAVIVAVILALFFKESPVFQRARRIGRTRSSMQNDLLLTN